MNNQIRLFNINIKTNIYVYYRATMPTAMSYAIDTILRLCEENTRLKCGRTPSLDTEEIVLVVNEKKEKLRGDGDDWDTLHEIPTETICQFLAEEHSYHIYKKPQSSAEEIERLKESADLIAESQQKQINLLLEDKRERMDDREKLLKEIKFYQSQLHELTGVLIETKQQHKEIQQQLQNAIGANVGRPKKKHDLSPCMSDPPSILPPYEHPHQ